MNTLRLTGLIVAVTLAGGGGFALGRQSDGSKAVHIVGSGAATGAHGRDASSIHDDSVPDTGETLSHEHLPDEDTAPTF